MLTARSAEAGALRSTGLLNTSAPGGIVMPGRPLKVSARSDPGTILEPAPRIARRAAPMVTALVPKAFESLTRNRSPPMVIWTISRRVCSLTSSRRRRIVSSGLAGEGLVAQVATQWEFSGLAFAAAARPMAGVMANSNAAGEHNDFRLDRRILSAILSSFRPYCHRDRCPTHPRP